MLCVLRAPSVPIEPEHRKTQTLLPNPHNGAILLLTNERTDMTFALQIVQLVLAVLLIGSVLLQQQGAGLGAGFGSGGGGVETVRRGPEKVLYRATIVISLLFFVVSLALVLL